MSSEIVLRLIAKFSLVKSPVLAAHKGHKVCKAMSASSYFAAFITQIGAADKEFDKLEALATGGAKPTSVEVQKQMKVCMGQAALLRSIVQQVADGDMANAALIIAAASMGSKKRPGPRPKADIAADWGELSGQVLLSAMGYPHASYRWQMSTDQASWTDIRITTQCKTDVHGLTAGTKYWFRVQVITSHGARDFTDPVPLLVK